MLWNDRGTRAVCAGAALAILLVIHALAGRAIAQPGMDELRGIETSRRATSPFRMQLKLTRQFRKVPLEEATYEVDCEPATGKFRFRNPSRGSCSLYDGKVVMSYDGRASAVIVDRDSDHSEFSYDPRLTGMTTFLRPLVIFEGRTDLISPENIQHVETVEQNGIKTVHFCVIDKYAQEMHYRVHPERDHRVVQVDFTVYQENGLPLYTDRMTSTYDEKCPVKWMPSRVELKETEGGGRLRQSMVMELSEVALVDGFSKDTFSLAGLGMPAGQPVADLRIKQRIGYWTGTGLSENLPPGVKSK